ncbi:hypothetical protein GYMLUDRAFT_83498 [Collybiopsis luxurians FD-317 M1]|uniref:Uncharacterized protein n=1 Tax=Collybiopsis luxurians FD-317 M1 TaxID=944289 RepID=A0A0D0BJ26_9AGAR|nr:hypothetical protein GYMLUDRAFT_83498 [Collybiopsis luxurians FD-317 M1]
MMCRTATYNAANSMRHTALPSVNTTAECYGEEKIQHTPHVYREVISITQYTLRPAWPRESAGVPYDQDRTMQSQVPESERELENLPSHSSPDVQNAQNQVLPAVSGEEQGLVPGAVEGDTAAELREVRRKMAEMMTDLEAQIDSERGQVSNEPPPDYTDLHLGQ